MTTAFGEYVRKRRRELDLTLDTVATALECSPSYVSMVERGDRGPFVPSRMTQLAKVLQVNVKTLVKLADTNSAEHVNLCVRSRLAPVVDYLNDMVRSNVDPASALYQFVDHDKLVAAQCSLRVLLADLGEEYKRGL